MSQTNLKSTDMCSYNQSASPFYWIMQPGQYAPIFTMGEVGVPANGGAPGSYIQPAVTDISSFLSGRDNILSNCVPPTPALDTLNEPKLYPQDQENAEILLPEYTKKKRSSNDLDAVDYNRWQPNLMTEPQNVRFVIEDMWPQRGGMDTSNYMKLAWKNNNNPSYNSLSSCQTTLRPGLTSDPGISGYPGVNPITGETPNVKYEKFNPVPKNEKGYPFKMGNPTSQKIHSVGASACGPNFFNGMDYDKGKCPINEPDLLREDAPSLQQFTLKV